MIAIIIVLPIIILGADVKLYSQYDSLLQDKLLIVTKNGFIYNYDLKYQQIRWISELGVSLQSDGIENGTHYIKPHKNGSFLFYDDVFYQINHDDLDILFKTCDMFHNALNYKTELIYFLDIATGNIKQLTQYDIHQLLSQPKLYEKGVLINILQNYISDLEYENSQQHNSRIQINFLLKYLRGDQTQLKLSNTTQIFKSKSGLYVHYLNKTLDLYLDDDVFEVFAYTQEEGIYSIIINQEVTGLTVHHIDYDMCELQGQCQINSTAIGIYKPSQFRQCLSQFYKVKQQNQIVPYQQTFSPKVEQCEKVGQDLNPFLMILLFILVVGYVSVAYKNKQQKPKEPQVTVVKEVQYVQVRQKEIKINKQKIIAAGSNGTKVYEGQLHGKPVAVKEINLQSLSNHIQEGVLEQAITTQMQLHSHHFVKYYFFEKHNEYLYLAMEKCLLNLKDFTKFESNPSLPEQQKLNIKQKLNNQDFLKAFLSDILSAFSLLQDKNIIHEGICPENIMFNDDYKVKLADLGLSRNENYYYQAVKKPFNTYSTLRQIGHMFYYLITKGDEIYLKKYLDEKILMEKLKKLNITIPETVDIVVKLILDQSNIDFETIRRHPFFWSNQRKLAFICEFSDYVETFPLAPDALSLQERCINNQVFKENWGARCGLILKYQIRGYDQTQAQQLIRLIRNTKNHYHQLPEDCKLLLGPTDESCFNYWNELFPNLFFTIYQHTLENKLNLLSLK